MNVNAPLTPPPHPDVPAGRPFDDVLRGLLLRWLVAPLLLWGLLVAAAAFYASAQRDAPFGVAASVLAVAGVLASGLLVAAAATAMLRRQLQRHVARTLQHLIGVAASLNSAAPPAADTQTMAEPSCRELMQLAHELSRLRGTLQTQRKALRASEERYLDLTQTVPVGLCRMAMGGEFLEANVAMADMLGFDQLDALFACEPQRLWVDPQEWRRLGEIAERTGVLQGGELLARRRDGRVIWVSVSGRVVAGGGSPPHIDAMVQDITERKRAEQERQQYRNELEELVALRTSELASVAKRAKVADRAKQTFLSNMSHELRTPLTAIMGYGQLLMKTPGLSALQSNGLNVIVDSGEHMLSLVEDLLDLSRIEAGRLELFPGEVELPVFLHGVAEIMRIKAAQKGLTLLCDMAPDLPRLVNLDAIRLRQVLLNLLGNAIKFTDRGEIRLCVRAVTSGSQPAALRFEVHDTGEGIAAEHLDDIFQPFEQLGPEGRRGGGMGLGLTISRELVQLMGGVICIQSTPGAGSVFWFEVATRPGDSPQPSRVESRPRRDPYGPPQTQAEEASGGAAR